MGSEHSSHSGPHRQGSLNKDEYKQTNIRRQHTIANPGGSELPDENGRPGSISPGPSVCSDIDLPYISYTVNRPIGDSPKLTNKQLVKNKSGSRRIQQSKQNKTKSAAHNIVVVRGATSSIPGTEKDPDVVRLQGIPMFLPIMRATLSLPAARDPEVDGEVTRIVNAATEKQRKFAKYAEKLSKVQELSHQLNRCHMLLNQTLESMETLNNYLDINDRLEPFVWTTG
ncbi:hypothetical protein NQ314_016156 [Rhamnusium bicolor]|uniref:BLOC-1-related complex subunit 5 n=1 Tax=Rhamnusium bicolor TaxID=1586634 RepID=A0AAV8WZC6_9CUCU|nr:hypothetical protein NQ314_016156 [Rhamnusium bicolor]